MLTSLNTRSSTSSSRPLSARETSKQEQSESPNTACVTALTRDTTSSRMTWAAQNTSRFCCSSYLGPNTNTVCVTALTRDTTSSRMTWADSAARHIWGQTQTQCVWPETRQAPGWHEPILLLVISEAKHKHSSVWPEIRQAPGWHEPHKTLLDSAARHIWGQTQTQQCAIKDKYSIITVLNSIRDITTVVFHLLVFFF